MKRSISKHRWYWLSVVVVLAAPRLLAGQDAFPREEFEARRERLFDKLGDNIGIVWGGFPSNEPVKFRQSPDLYYLCGIEDPEVVLLLEGRSRTCYLFSRKPAERDERWEGETVWSQPHFKRTYGVDSLMDFNSFWLMLSFLSQGRDSLYLPLTPIDGVKNDRGETNYYHFRNSFHPAQVTPYWVFAAHNIREKLPYTRLADINPFLDSLRMLKSDYEISQMKASGRIGAEGVKEAIRSSRPGMYEYELEAIASYHFTKAGARGRAFAPIVPSGPNLYTIHYDANDRKIEEGDLVMMDYGCDYNYYTSDITRTWPVSGKFSEADEKMYRCILEARNAILDAMKPGVTLDSLRAVSQRVYEKHGFGDRALSWNNYLGHFVGLSVHDPGPYYRNVQLQAGMVFNVEPVLDDPARKVHMRLEDTVLITEDGAVNLTADVPAELEEIYRLVNGEMKSSPLENGENK